MLGEFNFQSPSLNSISSNSASHPGFTPSTSIVGNAPPTGVGSGAYVDGGLPMMLLVLEESGGVAGVYGTSMPVLRGVRRLAFWYMG
jgi:hypothetical protein